jgi:hypothetical protein
MHVSGDSFFLNDRGSRLISTNLDGWLLSRRIKSDDSQSAGDFAVLIDGCMTLQYRARLFARRYRVIRAAAFRIAWHDRGNRLG